MARRRTADVDLVVLVRDATDDRPGVASADIEVLTKTDLVPKSTPGLGVSAKTGRVSKS